MLSCNKSMLARRARCGAEALRRTAESMQASVLHCCFCNYDFSWEDIHYAEHIESIWWPAGIEAVYEVRGDYCHVEAPVVITLVMELIGSLQWSSSAALLMFEPPHFPLVRALTHRATHESLMHVCIEIFRHTGKQHRLNQANSWNSSEPWFVYNESRLMLQHSPAVCATGHRPVMTGDGACINSRLHTLSSIQCSTHTLPQVSGNKVRSHTLTRRGAAISMAWCMGCHGCLVGGEVKTGGLKT